MVWGGASDLGKAKLVFAQKGVEIYVELHMKQILELSTCSRRKEGTVVLWDQSSVFLDEGCLGIKLTRSQRPGFRCPIYLGMKSLLFPVSRFAGDSAGGCLRPNFAGNCSARSQEFAGEIGCSYQS
ncbi:hypothetical protein Y032_0031g2384 [Ancylostoma ceylanicum]|uniref:Uncharacterized protein n=1 Tax=Ancylostoma ceylanicum TaxID=53326 RepID=A0A016US22_9BILA|nr:hypothetical protein Y032_0031g2384 [Ancylostoma ceylanicum]